jgi:hypothetical protein
MTYSAAANGTNAMNIYINGTSTTYTTNILNYAITTDGSSNSLGSYFNSSNSRTFFNGQLYYFYLFNTVIPTSDYNLLTA